MSAKTGGTFALYSLICRHSKVSAVPNQNAEEMELSSYQLNLPTKNLKRAEMIKKTIEKSIWAKTVLLSVALFGTCMVIGDGILTPCISGLYLQTLAFFLSQPHIIQIEI